MDNIDLTLDKDTILQELIDDLDGIVGDVPVSEQLAVALSRMAVKDHKHEDYATRAELMELKRVVEKLVELVGDVPVSEQIYNVIKNI